MNMRKIIIPLLILVTILCYGKDNSGAVNEKMLKEIRNSIKMDKYTIAVQNAISNNDIKALALNRSKQGQIDKQFAYRIDTPTITNQKSTGRCWLFTALNVLRPKIVEKYNLDDFKFSENYLFFWDQFEKANLFLEGVIKTRKDDIDNRKVQWLFQHPIGDGGVWSMMPGIAKKYGFVPKEIMPETYQSESTSMMRRILRRKLREQGLELREQAKKSNKSLHALKTEMLSDIYRILCLSLGTPPEKFSWRYTAKNDSVITTKVMTPKEFYNEAVDYNLNRYIMLMDDPTREYNKLYEIEFDRNLYDGLNWTFVNIPSDEIKKYAKKSILNDEPMYFSCDVGKQLDRDEGIVDVNQYDYESLFGIKFDMNKKGRILSYESGSSHGMSLMGIDTTSNGKITKWLLENSWGKDSGYNGFLIMTDEWFDEYMFRLVIKEEFIPEKIKKITKDKPIMLPPWDRMF